MLFRGFSSAVKSSGQVSSRNTLVYQKMIKLKLFQFVQEKRPAKKPIIKRFFCLSNQHRHQLSKCSKLISLSSTKHETEQKEERKLCFFIFYADLFFLLFFLFFIVQTCFLPTSIPSLLFSYLTFYSPSSSAVSFRWLQLVLCFTYC